MKSTSLVYSTLAFVFLFTASGTIHAAETRAAEMGVAGDPGTSGDKSGESAEVAAETTPKRKWSVSGGFSTSFVGGPINAGTTGETLTGAYSVPASFNPSLSLAWSFGAKYKLTKSISAKVGWSLSRGFSFCDTCNDPAYGNYSPGNGGGGSTYIVNTSDLSLGISHGKLATWSFGKAKTPDGEAEDLDEASKDGAHGGGLSAGLSWRLPASRDSLVCNPMYSSVGGNVGVSQGFEFGLGLSLSAGVTKSFFKYDAAPVGNCSPNLRNYDGTDTLTGVVTPDSYDGDRFASRAANASWSFSGGFGISGLHSWISLIAPKVKDGWFWKHFSSTFSIGVRGRLLRADNAYTTDVNVLTGPVALDTARKPVVWSYPISVGIGLKVHKHLSASLSWSNMVPQLLWDPGSYYRSIGYNSSWTLGLSGSY